MTSRQWSSPRQRVLLRLGHEHTLAYILVGLSWTVSFLVVRMAPAPYLIVELFDPGLLASFAPFDFWFAVCTVPLPFLLNTYWGRLHIEGM